MRCRCRSAVLHSNGVAAGQITGVPGLSGTRPPLRKLCSDGGGLSRD